MCRMPRPKPVTTKSRISPRAPAMPRAWAGMPSWVSSSPMLWILLAAALLAAVLIVYAVLKQRKAK